MLAQGEFIKYCLQKVKIEQKYLEKFLKRYI